MPNPQDVAVPSPPEREIVLPCRPASAFFHRFKDGKCAALERLQQAQERREDGWQGHWRPVYVGDALDAYARAAVIADRAAGRASAEPEGFCRENYELVPLQKRPSCCDRGFTAVGSMSEACCGNGACAQDADEKRAAASWLAAAPTPTASIAPKAEGEAVDTVAARRYPDRVEHSLSHLGERLAAPVAQAAAGALSDEEIDELWDVARMTGLGRMSTRLQAREFYRLAALSPRPEADADRASGGGVWLDIETAPEGVSVLACNSLGYVGRAVRVGEHWNGIGKPNGWMPMPKARATPTTKD